MPNFMDYLISVLHSPLRFEAWLRAQDPDAPVEANIHFEGENAGRVSSANEPLEWWLRHELGNPPRWLPDEVDLQFDFVEVCLFDSVPAFEAIPAPKWFARYRRKWRQYVEGLEQVTDTKIVTARHALEVLDELLAELGRDWAEVPEKDDCYMCYEIKGWRPLTAGAADAG